MKTLVYLFAAAATLCLAASNSYAVPAGSGGTLKHATDSVDPIEQAALFVFEGRRYCFYFNGWHGPGWYRCGFAWRRGLGWGGVYGWHGWEYAPAARRFGHGHFGVREGREHFGVRGGREGVRSSTSIREGSRTTSRSIRSGARVNEGASVRSSGSVRGRSTTTGSGRTMERSGAGANVKGGANVRGGASTRGGGEGGASVRGRGGVQGGGGM